MRQISFKNFRKFKDFPNMELGPITILVGANNAGKSTVVKAILSILDFLDTRYYQMDEGNEKSILNQNFYFNESYFAHVGTFKRALYNGSKDGVISFSLALDDISFDISVKGNLDDEESISAKVTKISITLLKWNIKIDYDFVKDEMMMNFSKSPSKLYDGDKSLKSKRKQMLQNKRRDYFETIHEDFCRPSKLSGESHYVMAPLIEWLLDRFSSTVKALSDAIEENKEDLFPTLSESQKQFFIKNKDTFQRYMLLDYPFAIMSYENDVEYIYAHAVTQTVIYSAQDTNDYFVKTIHEFANLRILEKSQIHQFITSWMEKFEIGMNYEIKSVGGEAHIVKIINRDGTSVNLADKGMGSIQLMILLFRLGTKMEKRKIHHRSSTTIIIEEPEQNLHPKLQSKLADLFLELNKKYRFNFIIETHSEYFIRKTQTFVRKHYNTEKTQKENPFTVYYFPSEGVPYQMKYRADGKFENSFGSGFFDEASNLAFELF